MKQARGTEGLPFVLSIGYFFLGLSTLLALGNIAGVTGAYWNRAHGIDRGYSCVPLVSLVFAVVAWFFLRHSLGVWVYVPSALDPGTWVSFCIPWVIWKHYLSDQGTHEDAKNPPQ